MALNPFKGPVRAIKLYKRVDKVLDLLEEATESHEKSKVDKMTKSLFKSKTFWFNLITGLLAVSDVLPIPVEYQALIVALGNVVLRFLTDKAVHVVTPKEVK